MLAPFIAFAANLTLGLIAIPRFIRFARAKRIIDHPNERSSHTIPTPRGGGIFICLGTSGCLLSVGFFSNTGLAGWACLFGSLTVIMIGFIDDLKNLPSLLRLGGHFLSAAILLAGALATGSNLETHVSPLLYWLAVFGLGIWIVGSLNIYNFMDGIDGIATVQGIAASMAWLAISYNSGSIVGGTLSCSILGGLLAFLLFNWSPAKVFMGDGASGFLGYTFAVLPIIVANPSISDVWLKINLGALCLFPFLFDGTFTLVRRALSRENLLEAHRSHLYQRWHQAGANHRRVASYYGAWALISGAGATLTHFNLLRLPVAYLLALIPAILLLRKSRCFPRNTN